MSAERREPGLAKWIIKQQETQQEREIWQHLIDTTTMYPESTYTPPWRSATKPEHCKPFVLCELVDGLTDDDGTPIPQALATFDGETHQATLVDQGRAGADALLDVFLAHRQRGTLLCFWAGARRAFHVLLRHYAEHWLTRSVRVEPLVAGTSLKALILRHKGRAYWLADIATMTGLGSIELDDFLAGFDPLPAGRRPTIERLWSALAHFQQLTLQHFGVALRATLPAAAVAAAAKHLPKGLWLWRPDPLLVSMCRAGCGFRGGYVYARRYIGPAWRADVNKLYTSALARSLPSRQAMGWCQVGAEERSGIYLCHVSGSGLLPAYSGLWEPDARRFRLGYWSGGERLAVLPSSEFAGLRALGYDILPRFGYVWTETFALSGYVQAIQGLIDTFGRQSPQATVGKLLGNAVYGKWGESSSRASTIFSIDRPSGLWHPFLDQDGYEVKHLWTRQAVAYRSHQQAHLAATVTAYGRSTLYEAASKVLLMGNHVLALDTDSVMSDGDLTPILGDGGTTIGQWRPDGYTDRAAILGRKAYAFGDIARVAGYQNVQPDHVYMATHGEVVKIDGRVLRPPWADGPMFAEVSKVLRPTQ